MDTQQACAMLGRSRATLFDMAERGLLTKYMVGRCPLYWRPDVAEVAQALRRLETGRGRG